MRVSYHIAYRSDTHARGEDGENRAVRRDIGGRGVICRVFSRRSYVFPTLGMLLGVNITLHVAVPLSQSP